MDKKDLIKQCRYYHGEDECPYTDYSNIVWFWDMERVYVNNNGKFEGERDVYKAIRGKEYPGVPFNLLMVMFTSWGKYTYDIKESIGEFYKLVDEYICHPNTKIK